MTAFFQENIALLRSNLPLAAKVLEASEPASDRRFVNSKTGHVAFQYSADGVWKNLTSLYDPQSEAERQTNGRGIESSKLIFVIGEAGLYHLEAVLERASKDARVVLMSNCPANLALVFAARDLTRILTDERLVVIVSEDELVLRQVVYATVVSDLYDIPPFTWVMHPVEQVLQQDFEQVFQEALHLAFTTSITNVSTIQVFEHWWVENFIANIPYVLSQTKVRKLAGSWAKRPVIIVGAGPSLSKNVQYLHEAKGRALILCVDTAYRVLVRYGIEPDLVVTLDGSPMNAEHMAHLDYSNVPLLMAENSHWDVTHNHQGPKIVITNLAYHDHWWTDVCGGEWEPSFIATGGSVATTALSFAQLIDADPVILVGVDLSYPGGRCYAEGALHESRTVAKQTDRKYIEITDIDGNPTVTTHDYLYYLRWLQQEAAKRDRRYVNATEGGALREGFLLKPLRAAIDEYCRETVPVAAWQAGVQQNSPDVGKAPIVLCNLKRSRRELRAARRYLGTLAADSQDYLTHLHLGTQDEVTDLVQHMNRTRTKLNRLRFALAFLDSHSFKTIYQDIRISEGNEQQTDPQSQREAAVQSVAQAVILFSELRDLANESIHMLDGGINGVENLVLRGVSGHESA